MREIDEYKKQIVEYFVGRSPNGISYKVRSERDIFRRFGNRNVNQLQEAFNELVKDKIIIIERTPNGKYVSVQVVCLISGVNVMLSGTIEHKHLNRYENTIF